MQSMSNLRAPDKNVTVIGGLLVDDIAISEEFLRARSSNPVRWQHKLGGVATNVARVVAQQVNTRLIACCGDDNQGELLAKLLAKEPLTPSLHIMKGHSSDRYTAVLDHDGELYIGLADARLAEQMQWHDIKSRLDDTAPDAFVLDANLSEQCLAQTVVALEQHYHVTVPIIALSVSPVKAQRWLPVAHFVNTLLCNRREAAALSGQDIHQDINQLGDALLKNGFSQFVITDGSNPVLVQELKTRHTIPVPEVNIEQTVNGAGDALAGASIAQLVRGQKLSDAIAASGMQAASSVLSGQSHPPGL